MKAVVIFAGKKGVGKSTAASMLSKELSRLSISNRRISFANPIKEICKILNYTHEQLYGTIEQKDSKGPWCFEELNEDLTYDGAGGLKNGLVSGREMAQIIGTELFRKHFSPNVWIRIADNAARLCEEKVVIVDDARLPNELNAFVSNFPPISTIRILMIRQTGLEDAHETEKGFDKTPEHIWNKIIQNNQSIEYLECLMDSLALDIQDQFELGL